MPCIDKIVKMTWLARLAIVVGLILVLTNAAMANELTQFIGRRPLELQESLGGAFSCEIKALEVRIPIITGETKISGNYWAPVSGNTVRDPDNLYDGHGLRYLECLTSKDIVLYFYFFEADREIFRVEAEYFRTNGNYNPRSYDRNKVKGIERPYSYSFDGHYSSGDDEEFYAYLDRYSEFLKDKRLSSLLFWSGCPMLKTPKGINFSFSESSLNSYRCIVEANVDGGIWRSTSFYEVLEKKFIGYRVYATLVAKETATSIRLDRQYSLQYKSHFSQLFDDAIEKARDREQELNESNRFLDELMGR